MVISRGENSLKIVILEITVFEKFMSQEVQIHLAGFCKKLSFQCAFETFS